MPITFDDLIPADGQASQVTFDDLIPQQGTAPATPQPSAPVPPQSRDPGPQIPPSAFPPPTSRAFGFIQGSPVARGTPSEQLRYEREVVERNRLEGERQLARENVRIGEAPFEIRRNVGYGFTDVDAYRRALGDEYEVKALGPGPYEGLVAFRKKSSEPERFPGQNPWTTVRDPNPMQSPFDVSARSRDIQSLVPEGVSNVGAAVVGGAAAAAGDIVPPILLAPAATFFASRALERRRMEEGQRLGVAPTGPEAETEKEKIANVNAFWNAVGEAGGIIGYRLFKRFFGRSMPDFGNVTPEMLQDGINRIVAKAGPGSEKVITIGDIFAELGMRDAASYWKTVEEKIASTAGRPMQQALAQRARNREAFAGNLAIKELPEGASGRNYDVVQLGRDIEARVAPQVTDFINTVLEAGGQQAVRPNKRALSLDIQETLRNAEKAGEVSLRQVFTNQEVAAGGVPFQATEAAAKIATLEDLNKSALIPSLNENARGVIDDLVKSVGTGTKMKDVTYTQVSEAIKDIRRTIRNAYKGDWKGDINQLSLIEDALVLDRNRILAARGGDVAALESAEQGWRNLKDTFRRAKLSDAFKVNPKVAQAESADEFLETVGLDADTAQAVLPYITKAQKDSLRAMLQFQLADVGRDYGPFKSNEIRQAVVERLLSKEDSPYRVLFTDAEIKTMASGARLNEMRVLLGVKERQNMAQWFDDFYNAKNPEAAEALFRRIGSNPSNAQIGETVRSMIRARLYDDLTVPGPENVGRILNEKKFAEIIDDPVRARWVSNAFPPPAGGPSLMARLGMVREATKALFTDVPRLNLPEVAQKSGPYEDIKSKSRAILGPMRREQRYLTYILERADRDTKERVARAILDPDYFQSLLRLARETRTGRATAAVLGQTLVGGALEPAGTDWVDIISTGVPKAANRAMEIMK